MIDDIIIMHYWFLLTAIAIVGAVSAATSPRRCAGRLARERLKAAEKIRDKRYFQICCSVPCGTYRRPRPVATTRRYQPFHKTWLGLKYGIHLIIIILA